MKRHTFFKTRCNTWKLLLLGLCFVLLCACGDDPPKPADSLPPPTPVESPEQIKWGYMPNGVDVLIVARDDINIVGDVNHAVLVKLLQVASQEGLVALAATQEGIRLLLEGTPQSAGILLTRQLYVQPASQVELKIDRAEGARYLAVVVGFDSLEPQKCFAISPFPIHQDTEWAWYGIPTDVYSPGLLDARIFLTEQQVTIKGFERVQK